MVKLTEEELEMEQWANIEGYSRYQVSDMGRIRSFRYAPRYKILSGQIDRDGYITYALKSDKNKVGTRFAHVLVAKAFLHNDDPEHKTIVNHKDEDTTNPKLSNLEWTTPKGNANHGTRNQRIGMANQKPINEYDINGYYIRTWKSSKYAAKIYPITSRNIQRAASGKVVTAYGRQWRYLIWDDINNIKPITNSHVLKYQPDDDYEYNIPSEYLYIIKKLTGAELYADMAADLLLEDDIPNYHKLVLMKIHEFLLKQCN